MRFNVRKSVGPLALSFVCVLLNLWALAGIAKAYNNGECGDVINGWARHFTDLDESEETRSLRLDATGSLVESITPNGDSRAVLLTLLYFESAHAARYIMQDRCSDGPRGEKECDSGRAVGPWQLHFSEDVRGDHFAQGRRALGRFRHHQRLCGGSLEGAFAGYAMGHGCQWAGAAERVAKYRQIVKRL